MLRAVDLKRVPTEQLMKIRKLVLDELESRRSAQKVDEQEMKKVLTRKLGGKTVPRKHHDLIIGEWDDLYPDVGGEKKFYVYAHVKPKTPSLVLEPDGFGGEIRLPGSPFYIGKGTGKREWDLARNEGHGAQLRSLVGAGAQPSEIVSVVRSGLTESEALKLEAKLIYFFGTKFEIGRKGILVNLDLTRRPARLVR